MGFAETLTIIFVLLKVFDVIDWSWWLVFLPEIIAIVFYAVWIGFFIRIAHKNKNKKPTRKPVKD